MKLYNKTKLPDEIIEPLLKQAGIQSGCKTAKVIIKLESRNSSYNCGVSGRAFNYRAVNDYYLTGKSKRMLNCEGYFKLRIPNVKYLNKTIKHDFIDLSQNIYSVAVHEFAHIKDYQKRITNTYENRNKPYRSRPCEIFARKVAKRAINHLNNDRQELILNLALWLENEHKNNEPIKRVDKYFTCANPNCTYNHLWDFGLRIPSYIKHGLFSACKCGEKSMIQCDFDKNKIPNGLVFTSVH